MTLVCRWHFPQVASYEHAGRWLQFIANLGRARNCSRQDYSDIIWLESLVTVVGDKRKMAPGE
jgi:hypothetical protein